jgi:predicted nucleic acid-binding protein
MIPVDILLDTTIIIDIFKGYQPAIDWLKSESDKNIAISGFTVFELLQGARNKEEMLMLQKKLEEFPIFWPSEDDCNRALVTFSNLFLSHGVEVIDTLIAHTAINLDVPIVTLNKKHYEPISGLKVVIPY